jgi:hypothetical protein
VATHVIANGSDGLLEIQPWHNHRFVNFMPGAF